MAEDGHACVLLVFNSKTTTHSIHKCLAEY